MQALGYIFYISYRLGLKSEAPTRRHGAAAGKAAHRPLSALRRWRARRAAILEINALPDRLLRDIGLERADIDAKVTALMGKQGSPSIAAPRRGVHRNRRLLLNATGRGRAPG